MKKKKKITKKKKGYNELSKKEKQLYVIKYVIITIVLSIALYFLTTFITRKVMDVITKRNETVKVHDLFENTEKSKSISVSKFIQNFNENLKENSIDYQVSGEYERKNGVYCYVLDSKKQIKICLEPVSQLASQKTETLSLSAIFVPKDKDNDEIYELVKLLLLTNNDSFKDKELDKIMENLNNEELMTEKDGVKTSIFYQERGLEVSKRITEDEVSYRIGRIMK